MVMHHGKANVVLFSNTPPQGSMRLNCNMKCFTLGDGRAFVSALAVMSSVGQ